MYEAAMAALDKWDDATRESSSVHFHRVCEEMGLEHTQHHDKSIALQELLRESMFADLLVIDTQETFRHYHEKKPTDFVRHIMIGAQCPILVVPSSYRPFHRIILLYDGSPSSINAIKQFHYLFGSMVSMPVEVLWVNPQDSSKFVYRFSSHNSTDALSCSCLIDVFQARVKTLLIGQSAQLGSRIECCSRATCYTV